ncbi:hypothetical protein I6G82_08540 [Lysinibacillus macroides]|uniref:hypothetical protein n=1 Tax=Lysinibacillus macroides TaxID=33935 RepID=UPI000A542D1A|nr:hypothetical protein [Lysinibacillus macroides]QPR69617.1 hypothetical protein I6G82_08540 [Lysinibacillus macroides]
MKKTLKDIENEIVEEYTSKLDLENVAHKIDARVAKLAASITRSFLEKYEAERNSN